MSNFNLIENTKSTLNTQDLFVAGSIVGSFLFFVMKSQRDKVIVLHKKSRPKYEQDLFEKDQPGDATSEVGSDKMKKKNDSIQVISEEETKEQVVVRKKPQQRFNFNKKGPQVNALILNPATLSALGGSSKGANIVNFSEDFMNILPKAKSGLNIEKPLFTEEELNELRNFAVKVNKKQVKMIGGGSQDDSNIGKRRGSLGNQRKTSEEDWSFVEMDAQEFDFKNIYQTLIEHQKKKEKPVFESKNILEDKRLLRQSEGKSFQKPGREHLTKQFAEDMDTSNLIKPSTSKILAQADEKSTGGNTSSISKRDKDSNSSYSSSKGSRSRFLNEESLERSNTVTLRPSAKFSPVRNMSDFIHRRSETLNLGPMTTSIVIPSYDSRSFRNPTSANRDYNLSRKEADFRMKIVSNVNLNLLLKIEENGEFKGSARIHFNAKIPALDSDLFLDFSGNCISSYELNMVSLDPKEYWLENKLFIPKAHLKDGLNNINIVFHSSNLVECLFLNSQRESKLIFYTNPNRRVSCLFPCFDQHLLFFNLTMSLLVPKLYVAISSIVETLNQPMTENFKSKVIESHTEIMKEDLLQYRLVVFKFFIDGPSLGFVVGPIEATLRKDIHRFFSPYKSSQQLTKALQAISEVVQLFTLSFKKKMFNTQKNIQKIDFIILNDLVEKAFGFEGIIFIDEKLIIDEEKVGEKLWVIVRELCKQCLMKSIDWYSNQFFSLGLVMYYSYLFFETMGSATSMLPLNDVRSMITKGKYDSLLLEILGGSHPLSPEVSTIAQGEFYKDEISVFKSFYFFKQISMVVGKSNLFNEALLLLQVPLKKRGFCEAIIAKCYGNDPKKVSSFKKWFENWVMRSGINELEPKLELNSEGSMQIYILQKDLSNNFEGYDDQVLREHLTDLTLINNSGRCQLTKEVSVHAEAETPVDHIERDLIPKTVLMDYNDAAYFRFKMSGRTLRFISEHINKVEQARNRLALYYNCYLEILTGGLSPTAFLDIVLHNLERESSYTVMKVLLKFCHQILRVGLEANKEFEYSESLINTALKMMGQGKFPNLMYKYISLFAYMPHDLEILESILQEKHMSIARFYKMINPKYKMYLATRLTGCEGITAERKEKIFNCFLEKCPIPILIENSKLCFLACSAEEKDKKEVWEYFINEANHSEKNFISLKLAMKCFSQQGQSYANSLFGEKFFTDLPHVASQFDRKYVKVFLRYLGPREKIREENEKWAETAQTKIERTQNPEVYQYLSDFQQLNRRFKESLKLSSSFEMAHSSNDSGDYK